MPLLTTEAVLTELFHLVRRTNIETAWSFVRSGAVESNFDCADPVTLACQRAPRSGVGISGDGNTMWLATVDGWQAGSVGLTAAELGAFLSARGSARALDDRCPDCQGRRGNFRRC